VLPSAYTNENPFSTHEIEFHLQKTNPRKSGKRISIKQPMETTHPATMATLNDVAVLVFNPYPNPPEASIPKETPCRIYYLNDKQSSLFIKKQNKQGKYVESIQHYLDPKSLKTATGVANLKGVKGVWVDEDPTTRAFPHHLISYNRPYQQTWGNQPLYGNVFIILSKKAWEALPEDKRLDDLAVLELTLQPTA